MSQRPPHQGRIAKGAYHSFEVVYLPYETRVYIYGPTDRPAKCENVQGQVTMEVRGNPILYRNPLWYVPPDPGSDDGGFLRAQVDVTQIRDGDMKVTVDLSDLPYNRQEPSAQFTQTFALTRLPLTVTRVPLTADDQPRIAAQRVCPVMNEPLGAHGEIIKVLVGQQPVYLCCEGCIEEVQKTPDLYLRQLAQPMREELSMSGLPSIRVEQVTADDRLAVEAQKFCPVMRQPLGAHGAPWKVLVDGQPVFVCCRGCVGKVEQQPAVYLTEARRLRGW